MGLDSIVWSAVVFSNATIMHNTLVRSRVAHGGILIVSKILALDTVYEYWGLLSAG